MSFELPLDSMSVAQKLIVIETVWDSLRRTPDAIPIPDWHQTVISERLARLESGEATLLDWEDVKKRLDNLGK